MPKLEWLTPRGSDLVCSADDADERNGGFGVRGSGRNFKIGTERECIGMLLGNTESYTETDSCRVKCTLSNACHYETSADRLPNRSPSSRCCSHNFCWSQRH